MSEAQLPSPAPEVPPVTEEKDREKAFNGYIREVYDLGRAQFDHLVEVHSGFWSLTDEQRWLYYTNGPKRDAARLQKAVADEQTEAQQYEQLQVQAAIAEEEIDPEVNPPPQPKLTDRERKRLESYMANDRAWYTIWVQAMINTEPEEAEKLASDYAKLAVKYGRRNGHA